MSRRVSGRPWWPILLLILSVRPVSAELNLSPREEPFEMDGIKLTHLVFENGTNSKTTYQPPKKWSYSGSDNKLQLQPPEKGQADIAISKVPRPDAIPFDETNREKLKQKAISSLPQDCSDIRVESEEPNPLQISGRNTYLFQLSYVRFGERFKRYFLLVDLPNGQLLCQLTSRERDYDQLVNIFQHSLCSWQHLI
ncbi:MAG TPA: hypothetical protein VFQ78_08520 [Candidatus Udaeobacter sp.]|nr:hypothetical protein [Candidatus Udaeobacter sp.]